MHFSNAADEGDVPRGSHPVPPPRHFSPTAWTTSPSFGLDPVPLHRTRRGSGTMLMSPPTRGRGVRCRPDERPRRRPRGTGVVRGRAAPPPPSPTTSPPPTPPRGGDEHDGEVIRPPTRSGSRPSGRLSSGKTRLGRWRSTGNHDATAATVARPGVRDSCSSISSIVVDPRTPRRRIQGRGRKQR